MAEPKHVSDVLGVDQIVGVHYGAHGVESKDVDTYRSMPVVSTSFDSRECVAPAVRKHPGAWPRPKEVPTRWTVPSRPAIYRVFRLPFVS